MKQVIISLSFAALAIANSVYAQNQTAPTLKSAYKDDFFIGAALGLSQIYEDDKSSVDVVKNQFSSIVAENCMKSMYLQPKEGQFFFDDADRFVALGEKFKMFTIGHTLIWHSQLASWFFVDEKGKDVSPEVLKQRMKSHIQTIVSRYKGKVKGWDVVNEAIMEDGSYRKSKFYEILGEEFIPLAFKYAQEADPDAELYYNDYNEWYPKKIETIVKMVSNIKSKGIRIDGVGMQAHVEMNSPTMAEYENAIVKYAASGVKINITELDISALPVPKGQSGANIADTFAYNKEINPYVNGLPKDVEEKWENRYAEFFRLFLKHKDKIRRVTLWGVTDSQSWKNDFPVKGRTDYPLFFDRNCNAKPIVEKIIKLAEKK